MATHWTKMKKLPLPLTKQETTNNISGASLMNTVINYASGKPSDPLRGYSYVHDSNLRQPCQIVATMHKMLSVTTVLA